MSEECKPDNSGLWFVLVLIMGTSGLSAWTGYILGKDSERDAAIRAGAAEWYLDDKHTKQFRYHH